MPTPKGRDEAAFLDGLLREGIDAGLRFLSDADARPEGAAHPFANLWDNGRDPIAGLDHEMEVRRLALEQFGISRLREGQPLADLQRAFVPVYLHHRYQLAAAVKSLGGVDYAHSVVKQGRPSPARVAEAVPADRQRDALRAVLATLRPEALVIPDRITALIAPTTLDRARGTAEYFPGATAPVFDPIACATVAADLAVAGLLQPQRAARLEQQHASNPASPGFREVIDRLLSVTWNAPKPDDPRILAVAEAVQDVVVQRLTRLAANDSATSPVRAIASDALQALVDRLGRFQDGRSRAALAEIRRFLNRPDTPNRWSSPLPAPPGDPIGGR